MRRSFSTLLALLLCSMLLQGDLSPLAEEESDEVIITITAATHLDKLEGRVLDLLVRVI